MKIQWAISTCPRSTLAIAIALPESVPIIIYHEPVCHSYLQRTNCINPPRNHDLDLPHWVNPLHWSTVTGRGLCLGKQTRRPRHARRSGYPPVFCRKARSH